MRWLFSPAALSPCLWLAPESSGRSSPLYSAVPTVLGLGIHICPPSAHVTFWPLPDLSVPQLHCWNPSTMRALGTGRLCLLSPWGCRAGPHCCPCPLSLLQRFVQHLGSVSAGQPCQALLLPLSFWVCSGASASSYNLPGLRWAGPLLPVDAPVGLHPCTCSCPWV